MDDGPVQPLDHPGLVPTFKLPLSEPEAYGMSLNVAFLGDDPTTVSFEGVIHESDGTTYGDPRCYEATGSREETDIVILAIFTKKS